MVDFAEKLYRLRKDKGITQEEFACLLDVSRQTVSNWERGEILPSEKSLEKICKVLRVKESYFYETEEVIAAERENKRAKGKIVAIIVASVFAALLLIGLIIIFG